MVRLLLKRGPEVNATSAAGDAALHHAVSRGDEKLRVLPSQPWRGYQPGGGAGHTLMLACRNGYLGVAQQLLQHTRGHDLLKVGT